MSLPDSHPLVSVIIVSWNACGYLQQCLGSLPRQVDDAAVEIIVVDNASVDGSPEMVRKQFPHVRLICNNDNVGFAKANNIGIAHSHGRYLALINSDVKVLQGCIEGLVDYCERHPRVGVSGPRVIGGDGKLQRSCRGFPSVWNMLCRSLALDRLRLRWTSGYALTHWAQENEAEVQILSGCFWLIRRDAYDQVGGLDEGFFMYGEDMDWCRRFWTAGWKLMFVPSAEAIHYGGASSSNSPLRFYIEKHRADLRYWRKHHSSIEVISYWLISSVHLVMRAFGYAVAICLRPREKQVYRYKIRRSIACLNWMVFGRMPLGQ